MNDNTREIIHHIIPAIGGSGVMLSLGEHFLFSIGVGVSIWIITHALSHIVKRIIK